MKSIKEYPLAIDFYDGRFSVQYFSYDHERDEPPPDLENEVTQALSSIFAVGSEALYWRTRVRRAKMQQYEKIGEEKEFFTVSPLPPHGKNAEKGLNFLSFNSWRCSYSICK